MVFIGICQLLQKTGVIEPDMHTRRSTTFYAERKTVEHRKKIEQHIQIGKRSAIELQTLAFSACNALSKQFLITRQEQVETFGNRKRKFSFDSFFLTLLM